MAVSGRSSIESGSVVFTGDSVAPKQSTAIESSQFGALATREVIFRRTKHLFELFPNLYDGSGDCRRILVYPTLIYRSMVSKILNEEYLSGSPKEKDYHSLPAGQFSSAS
jgi:hypothetical protein